MTATYWTGTKSNNFSDAANWSADQTVAGFDEVTVSGTEDSPALAVDCTPTTTAIPSLIIGDYGTLKITASECGNSTTPVFTANSLVINQTGSLIVETNSPVSLGFNHIEGTFSLIDSNNVTITVSRLSGNGTINLTNSTLGSENATISLDQQMTVNLADNSTLYAGFYGESGIINFDPNTTNMVVLNGNESTITTAFNNVSSHSEFAINGADGVVPASAKYTANADGSYSLVITTSDNKTVTLSDIHLADGYTPGTLDITKDAAGDYVIADSTATPVTPGTHDHHHGSGCHTGSTTTHHHDGCGTGTTTHYDHGKSGCGDHTKPTSGCDDHNKSSSGSSTTHQSGGCSGSVWKGAASCFGHGSYGSVTKPTGTDTGSHGSCLPDPWKTSGSHGASACVTTQNHQNICTTTNQSHYSLFA